ncbi:hypothetical protein [Propionivibrio sp.]|uniref:hypothetical protein n=1 Tax=Propionivibrio sp. TaxID=2212460 RepID=UPI003BF3DCDA
MSTVNFSVPDKVKDLFNATFAHKNKSAIIAELMLEAVERENQALRRTDAIDRILARRDTKPSITEEEIRTAREKGRP